MTLPFMAFLHRASPRTDAVAADARKYIAAVLPSAVVAREERSRAASSIGDCDR